MYLKTIRKANGGGQLDEVNFIRPIAIVLLVLIHALAPYTGAWEQVNGINDVNVYYWFGQSIVGCRIEALTFISGYLFAYIVKIKGREYTLGSLVMQKFKRLIIPGIVFSLLYSMLFRDDNIASVSFWYGLLNGYGHMWYLPMLFWCILAAYYLFKLKIREEYKLLLLSVVALFDFVPLPFRMDSACHFLFFFYLGGWCLLNKGKLMRLVSLKHIFMGLSAYIFFFIVFFTLKQNMDIYRQSVESWVGKAVLLGAANCCKLIYATVGLFVFYIIALFVTSRKKLPDWVVGLNRKCYGIYLFQQFVLIYLYYHSALPLVAGTYWLPWVAFVLATVVSVLSAGLFLKTRTGRFLIG